MDPFVLTWIIIAVVVIALIAIIAVAMSKKKKQRERELAEQEARRESARTEAPRPATGPWTGSQDAVKKNDAAQRDTAKAGLGADRKATQRDTAQAGSEADRNAVGNADRGDLHDRRDGERADGIGRDADNGLTGRHDGDRHGERDGASGATAAGLAGVAGAGAGAAALHHSRKDDDREGLSARGGDRDRVDARDDERLGGADRDRADRDGLTARGDDGDRRDAFDRDRVQDRAEQGGLGDRRDDRREGGNLLAGANDKPVQFRDEKVNENLAAERRDADRQATGQVDRDEDRRGGAAAAGLTGAAGAGAGAAALSGDREAEGRRRDERPFGDRDGVQGDTGLDRRENDRDGLGERQDLAGDRDRDRDHRAPTAAGAFGLPSVSNDPADRDAHPADEDRRRAPEAGHTENAMERDAERRIFGDDARGQAAEEPRGTVTDAPRGTTAPDREAERQDPAQGLAGNRSSFGTTGDQGAGLTQATDAQAGRPVDGDARPVQNTGTAQTTGMAQPSGAPQPSGTTQNIGGPQPAGAPQKQPNSRLARLQQKGREVATRLEGPRQNATSTAKKTFTKVKSTAQSKYSEVKQRRQNGR